jgi:hypothetical protein
MRCHALWAIRYRNVWARPSSEPPSRSPCTTCATPFASRLPAVGVPLIEVSAWMGHGLRAGGHEITNTTTAASTRRRWANGVKPRSTNSPPSSRASMRTSVGARRESVCSTHQNRGSDASSRQRDRRPRAALPPRLRLTATRCGPQKGDGKVTATAPNPRVSGNFALLSIALSRRRPRVRVPSLPSAAARSAPLRPALLSRRGGPIRCPSPFCSPRSL